MRSVDEGMAVEQSITTLPGLRPASTPSAPVSTASTWGEPVSTRITTSERAASSAALVKVSAPAALQRVQRLVAGVLEHRQFMAVLEQVAGDAVAHHADADHADLLLHSSLQSWMSENAVSTRPAGR